MAGLLTTCLDARQRAAVHAVCTDMHQPYVNAVARVLAKAEIVFDKIVGIHEQTAAGLHITDVSPLVDQG